MNDLFEARQARDEGQSRVLTNAGKQFWIDAFKATDEFIGQRITVQTIKFRHALRGYPPPHDPNHAWGAWTKEARRLGRLVFTGKWQQTVGKAKARDAKVYLVKAANS